MEFSFDRDWCIDVVLDEGSSSYLVIECLFRLMNFADRKSLEAIFSVLRNHRCPLVRHEAAFCLGEVASVDAAKVLREVLFSDGCDVVVHECLMSLGVIGDESDLGAVLEFVSSELEFVSASAKIAVERIELKREIVLDETNFDFFCDGLFDGSLSRNDRILVIFQLMRRGDLRAVEVLGRVLFEDSCAVVRHEAAFCLGEIGCERSISILKECLVDERCEFVVHEGLFALGTSGRSEVISFLEGFLDDCRYVVSESARIAIDRVNFLKRPYSGKWEFEGL